MIDAFDQFLHGELKSIDEAGLLRSLRRIETPQQVEVHSGDRELINFSSNDYLGLAAHESLRMAAQDGVETLGAGAGSARLISGSQTIAHELEAALGAFKQTEAALSFSSGYTAALGTVPALVGQGDVVIIDKLVHACLVDAARLSGAKLRVFKHNDLADLESILQWAYEREGNTLVITESVFSMDGDLAPVRDLVQLKNRYGAWLMLDEAHATGLYGEGRRGIAEEMDVADGVEVQLGTLGKALGAAGGYICGSQALIDMLVNRARSFIFSTAPVPAQLSAAKRGVELVQSNEGEALRKRLWANVDALKNGLIQQGWKLPVVRSAIMPLMIGDEREALALAERLGDAGVWVPAMRYPTVARGAARLRITVSAAHQPKHLDALLEALGSGTADA
ncbi:MAG TPA: 8-amino-7-oxononanoate synthase [Verrucomicrobiales bacterium]|nr:8-amino-7-oxononanoate synthase [Verrucomicrobiales bacterium]|tara:strand:+ start:1587 stop:2768 length:1182 start_codon:yes stop_codon:yes gene_type:complete